MFSVQVVHSGGLKRIHKYIKIINNINKWRKERKGRGRGEGRRLSGMVGIVSRLVTLGGEGGQGGYKRETKIIINEY